MCFDLWIFTPYLYTSNITGMNHLKRKLMFAFLNFTKANKTTKSDADIKLHVPSVCSTYISADGTLFVKTPSGGQPCALVQLPVSLRNWAVRPGIPFGHDFLLTCRVWHCPHERRAVQNSYVPAVGTWMVLRCPLFSATQQALSSDRRCVQSTCVEPLGLRKSCNHDREYSWCVHVTRLFYNVWPAVCSARSVTC